MHKFQIVQRKLTGLPHQWFILSNFSIITEISRQNYTLLWIVSIAPARCSLRQFSRRSCVRSPFYVRRSMSARVIKEALWYCGMCYKRNKKLCSPYYCISRIRSDALLSATIRAHTKEHQRNHRSQLVSGRSPLSLFLCSFTWYKFIKKFHSHTSTERYLQASKITQNLLRTTWVFTKISI